MKYGIVTVYNSENCGSFLQAYAMSQTLKKTQPETVFVRQNFRDHSVSMQNYLKMIAKTALRGNLAGIKRLVRRRKAFQNACRHLQIVEDLDAPSCCILGSDVIWDVTVPFFRNHHSFFWGTQFRQSKVISYAASVGFAKEEDIAACSFVRDALKNMAAVSVRDQTSKQLLQPYCDKEIRVVCDPTYLLDRSEYNAIAAPTDLNGFLFIYYYGRMSAEDQRAVQEVAKKEGLKTVTFGNLNPWCDISLPYDPQLFLSIYDKAAYIITNTFHGTVFATIYEKRFAVIRNDKPKILNVLKMCAMSDKMTRTADDISDILHSDFDYGTTRRTILQERENGLCYLREALEGSGLNG